MFCRISADRTQGGDMRYYTFRLTPYQLTIRDSDAAEPQPCCLLIAERVHSGYEGMYYQMLLLTGESILICFLVVTTIV